MKPPRTHWLFFLGLAAFYVSLSPGAILGMGYTAENVDASNQIISNLADWLALRPARHQVVWPRHGLFELIFEIPFLILSRVFFGPSAEWADRVLSISPVLVTSLICTLIFVWVNRITASLTWSYVIAMLAAFSTMLWPYAYIGLETTQSLFLLASGYIALGSKTGRNWTQAILFALSCGLAVSVKSNGLFLSPAIAFLIFAYLHSRAENELVKSKGKKALAIVATVLALYTLNAYTRALSPTWASGTSTTFGAMSVDGPLTVAFNMISLLGSVNKGLLVYCPVMLLCFAGLAQTYKADRRVAVFAALALGGLVGGCSLVFFWSDETWGPRYLHSAIAPLLICLAVSKQKIQFRFRREIPLIVLGILGTAVSFLGAFYYYGEVQRAATRSSQSTIEALQYDPNWNHIRINLKLLQLWMSGSGEPEPWPPARRWWYEQPLNAGPATTIDLRDFALPQPTVVRGWGIQKEGPYLVVWCSHLVFLVTGSLLLVLVGRLVSTPRAQLQPAVESTYLKASEHED
jgi:hypothetical protein